MLGTAVGLYVIPWCKKALLLTAMMSVIGFSMGVLDTGKNKKLYCYRMSTVLRTIQLGACCY